MGLVQEVVGWGCLLGDVLVVVGCVCCGVVWLTGIVFVCFVDVICGLM